MAKIIIHSKHKQSVKISSKTFNNIVELTKTISRESGINLSKIDINGFEINYKEEK